MVSHFYVFIYQLKSKFEKNLKCKNTPSKLIIHYSGKQLLKMAKESVSLKIHQMRLVWGTERINKKENKRDSETCGILESKST
jgi:hypothetical protein